MSYKVLITTSGTGSRLGQLTKYTNKALVRVGKKPAISYIIESYPKNTEFVIALGYKGDQVKDFLGLAYPEHSFTFVNIDKYDGPGTSLGYSMLKAQKKLQEPFIYHACDTVIEGSKIPPPFYNWVAGIRGKHDSAQYASFNFDTNKHIVKFNSRGTKKYGFIHVGLVGIKDYKTFWIKLSKTIKKYPNDSSLNDISGISLMIDGGSVFKALKISKWFDIGNDVALDYARKNISDRFDNLDKVDEALFFFDKFAIKFFSDTKKIKNRVKRGRILGNLVPTTIATRKNFYKYNFVKGNKFSDVVTSRDVEEFLDWAQKHLWISIREVTDRKFIQVCRNFYKNKTLDRINSFLKSESLEDDVSLINGEQIPAVKDLLAEIDFKWLSHGIQTNYHGDFILENILKTKQGYKLLDWRQDFGGLIRGGDMYYDLAKFYHNLVVNHDVISKNEFSIRTIGKNVSLSIKRKDNLKKSEVAFEKWVEQNNYDLKKVKVLRAIIWLNMSPLHHRPFNIFLFYLGKYYLWQILKEK